MPTSTTHAPDYEAILADIRVLNHLYAGLDAKPVLDPRRFDIVHSNSKCIVIKSICCETYYMADKHLDTMCHTFYTNFALAEPRERTVIDWVWL
jgi:hypothetical protein